MSPEPDPRRPPANNLGPVVREVALEACRIDRLVESHGVKRSAGELRHKLADLEDDIVDAVEAWRAERGLPTWERTRAELVRIAATALRAIRDEIDGGDV